MFYDVYTDLDEDHVTEVAYRVMEAWIAFALGQTEINGRRIKHPSGRYASSIRIEGRGLNHVAVVADENVAPEARWIEEGHGEIDMKQFLTPGRAYPMHRGEGMGPAVVSPAFSARTNNVWAVPRAEGFNGFARVGDSGWIIPAMAAYSPAKYFADMVQNGEFG